MLRTRMTWVVFAMVLALSLSCTQAWAQEPDTFKINYFRNANTPGAPPGIVVVTNSGEQQARNLCALIYVFRPDQQLDQCCGCVITHNEYREFDINSNLTFNPLTGTKTTRGTIKLLSSLLALGVEPTSDAQCNAVAQGNPGPPPPGAVTSGIKAWATHVQNADPVHTYLLTEAEFSEASLSPQEVSFVLRQQCFFAQLLGSGRGRCNCPPVPAG